MIRIKNDFFALVSGFTEQIGPQSSHQESWRISILGSQLQKIAAY